MNELRLKFDQSKGVANSASIKFDTRRAIFSVSALFCELICVQLIKPQENQRADAKKRKCTMQLKVFVESKSAACFAVNEGACCLKNDCFLVKQ